MIRDIMSEPISIRSYCYYLIVLYRHSILSLFNGPSWSLYFHLVNVGTFLGCSFCPLVARNAWNEVQTIIGHVLNNTQQ
jgi:hypothetical protein